MGFVIPHQIQARLIFQSNFNVNDWDKKWSQESSKLYNDWLTQLQHLQDVSVRRCIAPDRDSIIQNIQLHVFCDASSFAYACVGYIRVLYADGHVEVTFDMAKARIAPRNRPTVPRMELLAAVLGSEMTRLIVPTLQPSQVYLHTDSTNVLDWLKNEKRDMQIFVGNRIEKIRQLTEDYTWCHVPSEMNPADHASRGKMLKELLDSNWFDGPAYLKHPEDTWPKIPHQDRKVMDPDVLKEYKKDAKIRQEYEAMMKTNSSDFNQDNINFVNDVKKPKHRKLCNPQEEDAAHGIRDSDVIKWTNHSNLFRLTKAVARILRMRAKWLKKVRNPARVTRQQAKNSREKLEDIPILTAEELNFATKTLLKLAQAQCYQECIQRLQTKGELPEGDPLRKLRPLIDEDGLLRVGARLRAAEHLHVDVRAPIMIHYKHPMAILLIKDTHERVLHHCSGELQTMSELLKTYMIPRVRRLIRNVLGKCYFCRKHKHLPVKQEEAPMPLFRVPDPNEPRLRAFQNTAVDLAGPFTVKQLRKSLKIWIVVFVCATFKCVHLEEVRTASADSFLMAFTRFVTRCGLPHHIISDHGTNLTRTADDLRKAYQALNNDKIKAKYPQITWRFSPPGGPWHNSLAERTVQSVKRALNKLVEPGELDSEQFTTALTMAEGVLNSRPISFVSNDASDPIALSPNNFLPDALLRDLGPYAQGVLDLQQRFKQVDQALDRFWCRYIDELTPRMHQYNSLLKGSPNLEEGDVVAMLDKGTRGHWPLGLITKTFPNPKDGKVRQVQVYTNDQFLVRPVQRLMLLVKNIKQ